MEAHVCEGDVKDLPPPPKLLNHDLPISGFTPKHRPGIKLQPKQTSGCWICVSRQRPPPKARYSPDQGDIVMSIKWLLPELSSLNNLPLSQAHPTACLRLPQCTMFKKIFIRHMTSSYKINYVRKRQLFCFYIERSYIVFFKNSRHTKGKCLFVGVGARWLKIRVRAHEPGQVTKQRGGHAGRLHRAHRNTHIPVRAKERSLVTDKYHLYTDGSSRKNLTSGYF